MPNPNAKNKAKKKYKRNKRYKGYLKSQRGKPSRGEVKSIIKKEFDKQVEDKYIPLTYNVIPSASRYQVHLATSVAQGVTASQRTGNSIRSTALAFRFAFRMTSTVSANVRVIVVYDKQSNGFSVNQTDLLQSGTTNAGTNPLIGLYNPDWQQRFRILYDKSITLNPDSDTSDHRGELIGSMKLYDKPLTKFLGAGSGTADIASGAIVFIVMHDGTNVGDINYSAGMLLRYEDA